jgi:hypothetical protein
VGPTTGFAYGLGTLHAVRAAWVSTAWALVITTVLMIAPSAFATRADYGGEVERAGKDVGHIRLSIRFARDRPKEVNNIHTSLLPLDCQKGHRGFTADVRRGRQSHAPIGSSGEIKITHWKFGKSGSIRGTLKTNVHVNADRARGRIHYRVKGSHHGVCRTRGWLRFSAPRHRTSRR